MARVLQEGKVRTKVKCLGLTSLYPTSPDNIVLKGSTYKRSACEATNVARVLVTHQQLPNQGAKRASYR